MKTCPDCAEAVQPAAKVCRFCGYRFVRKPELIGSETFSRVAAGDTPPQGIPSIADSAASESSVALLGGALLSGLGAAGAIAALFLPLAEYEQGLFTDIADNTPLEGGILSYEVIGLALFAILVGSLVLDSFSTKTPSETGFALMLLGGVGLAVLLAYVFLAPDTLTLYPLDDAGEADASKPGVDGEPAAAIYAAGVSTVLVLLGGGLMSMTSD